MTSPQPPSYMEVVQESEEPLILITSLPPSYMEALLACQQPSTSTFLPSIHVRPPRPSILPPYRSNDIDLESARETEDCIHSTEHGHKRSRTSTVTHSKDHKICFRILCFLLFAIIVGPFLVRTTHLQSKFSSMDP